MKPLRVAKVGGSLFDWPELRPRLWAWIQSRTDERVLLIPGGGDAADLVRNLQVAHELDESTAHWLAVRAMSLNAHVLASLLSISVVTEPGEAATAVLDVHPFLIADDGRPGALEHSWRVTSDSIAARFAQVHGARLTLFKSVALPSGMSWVQAATAGLVDAAFPQTAAGLSVEWVNLRTR